MFQQAAGNIMKMNFIRKKMMAARREQEEGEEEDKDKEKDANSPKPGEDWQFLQQLTMKVQDTVQKTQTTLSKLKDIGGNAKQENNGSEDSQLNQPSLSSEEIKGQIEEISSNVPSQPQTIPSRPPPPTGHMVEEFFPYSSSNKENEALTKSPKPPQRPNLPQRPPPPPTSLFGKSDTSTSSRSPIPNEKTQELISESASMRTPPKTPPRPPPPSRPPRPPEPKVPPSQAKKPESLFEDFGFQNTAASQDIHSNVQDLLFLDQKISKDPFDTTANLGADNIYEKQKEEKLSQAKKENFNPFYTPETQTVDTSNFNFWENQQSKQNIFESEISPAEVPSALVMTKKRSSNPFISETDKDFLSMIGSAPEANVDLASDNQIWSKNNPFGNMDSGSTSTMNNTFSDVSKSAYSDANSTETISKTVNPTLDSFGLEEKTDIAAIVPDVPENSQTTEKRDIFNFFDNKKEKTEPFHDPVLKSSEKVKKTNDNVFSNKFPGMAEIVMKSFMDSGSKSVKNETCLPLETDPFGLEEKTDITAIVPDVPENSQTTEKRDIFNFFDSKKEKAEPFHDSVLQSSEKDKKSNDNVFSNKFPGMAEFVMKSFMDSGTKSVKSETCLPLGTDPLSNYNENIPSNLNKLTSSGQTVETVDDTFITSTSTNETKFDSSSFDMFSSSGKENIQNACSFTESSAFDAFEEKFENLEKTKESSELLDQFDPFLMSKTSTIPKKEIQKGFSIEAFDVPVEAEELPKIPLMKQTVKDSFDDDDTFGLSITIKPKAAEETRSVEKPVLKPLAPLLPPPPKEQFVNSDVSLSRFNPFNKGESVDDAASDEKAESVVSKDDEPVPALGEAGVRKTDSEESPSSPLFDEDISQPLEEFPSRVGTEEWDMVLRQPNRKKITGKRFWKKVHLKLPENGVLHLYNNKEDKLPFQELPLQACYSLSEIGYQQFDQYSKIFTVKLQYIFYRERVGVRPGQVSKVVEGQIQSISDVAKLGLPLQHTPQVTQLLKLGTQNYHELKSFIQVIEDALFHLVIHRDRALSYKAEEVQVSVRDEFYVEQSLTGVIEKQLARVRVFFLAFITGMPVVEVGLNDIIRQGKEVVGRYDIIPVVTEEWIRLEDWEFHASVIQEEFEKNRLIKFHPPDGCLFELMRFRVRPPKNRELAIQLKVTMSVTSSQVEIKGDMLVPGCISRKHGQIPCEDIQISFPIPECWIYLFRTEKHFHYGSKKSATRKPGKIKGIERIVGTVQPVDSTLIEVSTGQAKYEHAYNALVWRIPRLPKEGQGAYTTQLLVMRLSLSSFDQIPETFDKYVNVEFYMPATTVSHTTVRSVSVTNPVHPEKHVKYLAKHEYKVEIDFISPPDEVDFDGPTPVISSLPRISPPVAVGSIVNVDYSDSNTN